jgi:hypothetical protein
MPRSFEPVRVNQSAGAPAQSKTQASHAASKAAVTFRSAALLDAFHVARVPAELLDLR